MSVKEHYEVMTHEVTEKVLVGKTLYCDICKKEIKKGREYWEVTTGHHDWGNDSFESIEDFDVCSDVCLMMKFGEYIDRSKDGYNTEYIEVKREQWR